MEHIMDKIASFEHGLMISYMASKGQIPSDSMLQKMDEKVERNRGRKMTIGLMIELIEFCDRIS